MFRQVFRQVTKQSFTGVKRTYATEAAVSTDALKLSLALPHQTLYNDSEVQQVNLPSVNGDLGILANHIPIVEQLRPGLLEIISKNGDSDQYFVSGGIAMVQPKQVDYFRHRSIQDRPNWSLCRQKLDCRCPKESWI